MKSTCTCDISSRPLSMTVERLMGAPPELIYRAWTEEFDRWFAEPGTLMMKPEIDRPYFFKSRKDWGFHPHHGRFVELEKDRLIAMTWVTGAGGTEGAETLIRIELVPQGEGTLLKMTHSGFRDETSRDGHEANWPEGLETLDEILKVVAGGSSA
jgi:uncharacterized protein YndB with AHSA1/START domain